MLRIKVNLGFFSGLKLENHELTEEIHSSIMHLQNSRPVTLAVDMKTVNFLELCR